MILSFVSSYNCKFLKIIFFYEAKYVNVQVLKLVLYFVGWSALFVESRFPALLSPTTNNYNQTLYVYRDVSFQTLV